VVKIGGSLRGEGLGACADIRALREEGHAVVVVHGGGAEADALGRELRRPARQLTSDGGRRSRYTDAQALDTLTMALLGRMKPALVAELAALGVPAVGLSGLDGGLVTAKRNAPVRAHVDGQVRVVRDDLSGRIAEVDPRLLRTLLQQRYVPVVSPPVLDAGHGLLNIDADRLAAGLAAALGAAWLIVLSDVPGLLGDPADETSLIAEVPAGRLEDYLGFAAGRMTVKLRAGAEAARAGVGRVVLADGRVPGPILAARAGAGTSIRAGVR
jgi:[amino group carrier protein]-L-2-aminoadipate 6-kinase